MRGLIIAIVCGFGLTALVADEARSQEAEGRYTPTFISKDEAIARVLEKKDKGIVVFDVIVSPGSCDAKYVTIGRKVDDGKWLKDIFGPANWGMRTLVPGEYTIFSVGCQVLNRTTAYNGSFATFRVGAGELVDVGVLKLQVTMDSHGFLGIAQPSALYKSVERSGEDLDQRRKRSFPHEFVRMIRRPMTIVGPAHVGLK
jgi:hypothetical protein